MASPWFTEYKERSAKTKGSAPDPIPRKSGGPGQGKVGTYTHPKGGTARAVRTKPGPRVKTSMEERY